MALSRPFILALLGALLAVATFAALRSAADRAQADDTPPAPTVVQTTEEPASTAPQTTTTPASQAKPKKKAAKAKKKARKPVSGVPRRVGRALAARRTVVLFFRQSAADDDATAAAVRSVRGVKGVSVFSAPIGQLARYRRVIASLGVTQAPAVVVVGKDRKARVLEGFVDGGTLRQRIKDSR